MSKKKENKIRTTTSVKQEFDKEVNIPFLNWILGKEVYFAVFLIALVAFFVFKDFLLFKKLFLYKDVGSDTLNAFYPQLKNTAKYIHENGMPSWSFNSGMGQNIFPFFLHGPFDLILYLVGSDNLHFGLGIVEFLKVLIGGSIFFLYLRIVGINTFTSLVGGLIYSFSGFMILGGGWYVFSYEAINIAILLLAFERLLKYNSWFLFPLAIAGISISMPFNLYIYGLFLFIYSGLRFFEQQDDITLKSYFRLCAKMIFLGLLGVGLGSFFLFENILQLIESPRGSGDNSYSEILSSSGVFKTGDLIQNVTSFFRLFSSDLLGSGSNYKGWSNYLEAPMFYCGILSVLLFPQLFILVDSRRKIVYGVFLLMWIVPVIFPYFRYAFWLFTGDYYRAFSVFVSFSFLFISLRGLNLIVQLKKINKPLLLGTLVVLLLALSFPYFKGISPNPIDKSIMTFVKFTLVVYALLIYGITKNRTKQFAQLALLFILCIELGYLSNITVNKRAIIFAKEMKEKTGYNDYTLDANNYIKKMDNSFYRIDKNYSSSPASNYGFNDALVQDYYGTSSYHSFNQKYYILFLQAINIAPKESETKTRWAEGLNVRPLVESIGSVKYFLDKNGTSKMLRMSYDSIAQFGDVKILKKKHFLPMGFAYDTYIKRSDFDKLSKSQKDMAMLKTFFIDDSEQDVYKDLKKFDLKDTLPLSSFSFELFNELTDKLKKDTLNITERSETLFKGTFNLDNKKLVFFSIPFDKGWKATIDGIEQELKIVDAGMTGLLLDKGKHKVELKFVPRYRSSGLVVSLLSVVVFGLIVFWKRKNRKYITTTD